MFSGEYLLDVNRVTKRYGDLVAVNDLSLQIRPGEIFALLGPNGAGKTTLIGCITGLIQHFEGSIRVADYDVSTQYRITRQVVGLVPQELNFDGFFTGNDVLKAQGGLFGRRDAVKRGLALMHEFSLAEKAKTITRWLSGGMKRRLMICKALMHDPALLFLDEPTAGVDVELRDALWEYVRRIRDEGMTICLTTHYLEEAEKLADRIGIINKGKLLLVEERDALFRKYGSDTVHIRFEQPLESVDRLHYNGLLLEREENDNHILRMNSRSAEGSDVSMGEVLDLLANEQRLVGNRIAKIDTRTSSLEDIFRRILRENDSRDSSELELAQGMKGVR